MSEKISVIVPVYNVEKYVEKCIESILSQTYRNYEIIILNDGSTDSSYDILLKYKDNPRITIVDKKNTGQSDTRYQGLLLSKGEYIYHVDADDFIEPCTLELLASEAEKTNADMVFGRYRLIDEQGKTLREQRRYKKKTIEGRENILSAAIHNSNYKATLWLKLIRKTILTASYNEDIRRIRVNEDVCLSVCLAFYCKKIAFINDIIYNVLQRQDSVSRNKNPDLITINDTIYAIIRNRLKNINLWYSFESVFYNGYVKTISYALALSAEKCSSYKEYLLYFSSLDKESIYYSKELKKKIHILNFPYREVYIISRFPKIFFITIRLFKRFLKH